MKKWLIVLVACLLFAVDGNFANFFPGHLFSAYGLAAPRFLFVFILLVAIYCDAKTALVYAAVFGLITDFVFTEIYGIYLFWYPAAVYLVTKIMKVLHSNWFIVMVVTLFAISVLEGGLYLFYSILTPLSFSAEEFFRYRFFPTLYVNLVFYLVAAFPLRKGLSVLKREKDEERSIFDA